MDPDANLAEQEQILSTPVGLIDVDNVFDMFSRLLELRSALTVWLQGGGVEPDWLKAPRASRYYGRPR